MLEKQVLFMYCGATLHAGLNGCILIITVESILKLIHLSANTSEPEMLFVLHHDINLITLLMGAQGLQSFYKTANGEWIDAIAEQTISD
jgi:hypothetical protein